MDNTKIKVKIVELYKTVFQGELIALSAKNLKGNFDLLPDHTNFITVVSEKLTLVFEGGKLQEMPIESGVMRCLDNSIEVYLGIKVSEEQLQAQPSKESPVVSQEELVKQQHSQLEAYQASHPKSHR